MNHIPNYKNSFRILKGGKISLVVSAFLATTTLTFASPSGGTVTSGSANISQTGKVTDITQSTQKASINWNKFNVANDETVNFKQPNVNSITLNRVIGNEKSIINGALNANGQVWILNSNGVLFSKDAKVNTAGLIATTKELSDTDFQAGNYNFKGNSKESVINLGTIDVVNGGSVILAANEVRNEGTIKAIKGKVHLVGANEYTVNLNGNSLVNLTVNKGVLDALVKNSGTIIADGGEVYLTTNAVNELLKGVVNNTGVIEANSMDELFGKVELFAHGGTGEFDGEITAKGGFVETSGKEVDIKSTLEVKAKDWLIDPTNITINSDSATAYETSLNAGTNVTIETDTEVSGDGDITVATNISKTAGGDATLTLKAAGNIIISKDIKISSTTGKLNTILWSDSDATNGGGITMNAGSSINTNGGHLWMGGGSTATIWNGLTVGNSYAIGTGIRGTSGLAFNGVSGNMININTNGGNIKMYGLGPVIGGSGVFLNYTNLNSGANGGIDIKGDGYYSSSAYGNGHGVKFNGSNVIGGSNGVTVTGRANTNSPATYANPLLFLADSNSIYAINAGLLKFILDSPAGSVGMDYIGNYNGSSTIGHETSQTGNIEITTIGASINALNLPNILTSGNLIVDMSGSSTQSLTQSSGSKVVVGGTSSFKANANTDITLINADNDFTGSVSVDTAKSLSLLDKNALTFGSVAGVSGKIDVATTTGDITLNGNIATTSTAADAITINAGKSKSAGNSTGGDIVHQSGTITTGTNGRTTFYTGSIVGSNTLATLIGSGTNRFRYNSDELSAGYTTALGSGLYAIYREQPTISINPNTKSMTYSDALPSFDYVSSGYQNGDTNSILGGTATYEIDGTKSTSDNYIAGSHDIKYKNGLTNALGYAISDDSSINNELKVAKRALTISGITADNKVYDGTTTTTVNSTNAVKTGLVGGDDLTLATTSGVFADKNAGAGKTVNLTTTYEGADKDNYEVTNQTTTTAEISKKDITAVTGITAKNKVYDGTTDATLVAADAIFAGMIANDKLNVSNATGAFINKEVGNNKIVNISNLALGGVDTNNYNLISTTATTNADITSVPTPPTPDPVVPEPEVAPKVPENIIRAAENSVTPPIVRLPNTSISSTSNIGTGSSNSTSNVNVVSQPTSSQSSQSVSLGQLQQSQTEEPGSQGFVSDIRVPASANSQIILVNGGVRLPDGVEQEFYVSANQNNTSNESKEK